MKKFNISGLLNFLVNAAIVAIGIIAVYRVIESMFTGSNILLSAIITMIVIVVGVAIFLALFISAVRNIIETLKTKFKSK